MTIFVIFEIFVLYLEYMEVTKEREKIKNDLEIGRRKFGDLNLEKKVQNEELQKVTKENSQKKKLEKLLILENAKVANLEKELFKLKEELQSKTALLEESKFSIR